MSRSDSGDETSNTTPTRKISIPSLNISSVSSLNNDCDDAQPKGKSKKKKTKEHAGNGDNAHSKSTTAASKGNSTSNFLTVPTPHYLDAASHHGTASSSSSPRRQQQLNASFSSNHSGGSAAKGVTILSPRPCDVTLYATDEKVSAAASAAEVAASTTNNTARKSNNKMINTCVSSRDDAAKRKRMEMNRGDAMPPPPSSSSSPPPALVLTRGALNAHDANLMGQTSDGSRDDGRGSFHHQQPKIIITTASSAKPFVPPPTPAKPRYAPMPPMLPDLASLSAGNVSFSLSLSSLQKEYSRGYAESLIESKSISEASFSRDGDDDDDDSFNDSSDDDSSHSSLYSSDEDEGDDSGSSGSSSSTSRHREPSKVRRRRVMNGGVTPRYPSGSNNNDATAAAVTPTTSAAAPTGMVVRSANSTTIPRVVNRPIVQRKSSRLGPSGGRRCDAIIIISGGGGRGSGDSAKKEERTTGTKGCKPTPNCRHTEASQKAKARAKDGSNTTPSSHTTTPSVCMQATEIMMALRKFRLHKGAIAITDDAPPEKQQQQTPATAKPKKDAEKRKKEKQTSNGKQLSPSTAPAAAVTTPLLGTFKDASEVAVFDVALHDEVSGKEIPHPLSSSFSDTAVASSNNADYLRHHQHHNHVVIRVTVTQPTLFYREQIRLHNNCAPLAPDLPFPEAVEELKACHKAVVLTEFLTMVADRTTYLAQRQREKAHRRMEAEKKKKQQDEQRQRQQENNGEASTDSHKALKIWTPSQDELVEITICATHDDAFRQRVWHLGTQWRAAIAPLLLVGTKKASLFSVLAQTIPSFIRKRIGLGGENDTAAKNTSGSSIFSSSSSPAASLSPILTIAERPLFEYFGADTMYYFAFMNYFHYWLLFSSVVAILMHAVNWYYFADDERGGDGDAGSSTAPHAAADIASMMALNDSPHSSARSNPIIPFYSIVTMLSSVLFVKLWERRVETLACDFRLNSDETSRAPVRRGFYGEVRASPITGERELHYPSWKRSVKQVVSWSVSVVFLLIGLFVQLCSINLQGYMNLMTADALEIDFFDDFSDEGAIFDMNGPYAMVPVVLHVLVVMTLNSTFTVISEHLTDWENYRTDMEATTALTQKRLGFEFFNNFTFLFYIAFYRFDLPMLTAELQSLFWMDQLRRLATESLLPYAQVYSSRLLRTVGGIARKFIFVLIMRPLSILASPLWKALQKLNKSNSKGEVEETKGSDANMEDDVSAAGSNKKKGRRSRDQIKRRNEQQLQQSEIGLSSSSTNSASVLAGVNLLTPPPSSQHAAPSSRSSTGSIKSSNASTTSVGKAGSSNNSSGAKKHNVPSAAREEALPIHCDSKLQEADNFDDFLEMTMQFGYVTLFASAFPLASLFALICGLVEIRSDLFKKCFIQRRTVVVRTAKHTIYLWTHVLRVFAFLSVITNTLLFSFTTGHMQALVGWWQRGGGVGVGVGAGSGDVSGDANAAFGARAFGVNGGNTTSASAMLSALAGNISAVASIVAAATAEALQPTSSPPSPSITPSAAATAADTQLTITTVAFLGEHVFLLVAFFLYWRIPSTPSHIEEEQQRRRYRRVRAKVQQLHAQLLVGGGGEKGDKKAK